MENPKVESTYKNPLRLIFNTTIFVFIVLLIFYVGSKVGEIMLPGTYGSEQHELLRTLSNDIRTISLEVFSFVRPFLQLIIILIILEWLLNKFGLSLKNGTLRFDWNVQTIIGLVIIIAFALAALSGVEGAGMLKDVALVVVGFYFGTQKRTNEIVQGDSKIVTTEEHTNERSGGAAQ